MKKRKRNWKHIGETVDKIRELGLSYKEGAERFGLKVWELYEYNKRENRLSQDDPVPSDSDRSGEKDAPLIVAAAANDESSTETRSTEEADSGNGDDCGLPSGVADLIREYRNEHPKDGFKRIEQELKRRHHIAVSRKQIRSVLKASGLLESCDSSFNGDDKSLKGTRRFEAAYPGELYQMDVSYVYLEGLPTFYLVVLVDDHSRFCLAAELCCDQKGETLIGVLHNGCVAHGYPVKLLTDQGTGFYTWNFGQTRFQRYLDGHRIEHIVCDPHSPQTQGKVERLIQTLKRELLKREHFSTYEDAREGIRKYVHSYNYDRAHQSLEGLCPADRFYGVAGENLRLKATLMSRKIDVSKGFLSFCFHGRTLSVVCCSEGLQVYLDGVLLMEEGNDGSD